MKWFILFFVLFVVLTPGILLRLPQNGSKLTVAAVHGFVLAVIIILTHKYFYTQLEGAANRRGTNRRGTILNLQ